MELMRLGPAGSERPAVRSGADVFSLDSLTGDIDGHFLEADGVGRVRRALKAGSLTVLPDADTMRIGSPVARPQAVVCIGQNYAAHAAESGSPPPQQPIIFFKHPNTVAGPNDPVTVPEGATQLDWEVELVIVIGKRASQLTDTAQAAGRIAGWTLANDVSERRWQKDVSGGQWSKGKTAPGFCPLGPALIPADELSADSLRLRSWVNGEPRQDSSTADLIFSPAFLVCDLSHYMTLEPGDIILTGTPEGVAMSGNFPFLKAGDVVDMQIDGIGRQRQTFVAASDER